MNGYDRDLGFNGDLLYVISNGDFDSVFKIDTLTGELFVDAQLDRETTTDYLLNITVQDQGSPRSKAVSKLLHIIIEDVNDNAPQFIKSSFSFFLKIEILKNVTFINFKDYTHPLLLKLFECAFLVYLCIP